MPEPDPNAPTPPDDDERDRGVADALRSAVERTMRATAGSAASTRGRAADLVDDVVRRGREARDELAKRGYDAGAGLTRRGQEAGAGLARRGQEATGEVGKRIEALERRLAKLESTLGDEPRPEVEDDARYGTETKPKAED